MNTEDHLIERGLQAQTILNSDAFNDLYEGIVTEIGREILETPLEDPTKYRESLFLTVHGMRSFAARLTSYVVAMKEIESARNDEHTQDDD